VQTATNPETGARVALVGDTWTPIEQTASNDKGEKAYLIAGKWITDTPTSRVDQIPGISPQAPAAPEPSFADRLTRTLKAPLGAAEAALAVGSGVLAAPIAAAGAVGRSITSGGLGTPENNKIAQDRFKELSSSLTYRPRSEVGQEALGGLSDFLDASKLAGLPPYQAVTAGALAAPAARQAAASIPSLPARQAAAMPGMGAAMTDIERLRWERAQQLPVPLPLTKAGITRDFEQQRFERETAKAGEIGRPLRERSADLNERILQNFDAFLDNSGAEAGGLRATGQIVNDVIVGKAKMAKARITNAYEKARQSGDMQEPVNVAPIQQYIESHRAEAINAPIISSLEAKLGSIAKLDASGNAIATINDLEEVRKMVGALSGKDATNAHFGKEIKGLLDGITENAGGADYKRARALRLQYGKEFEDVGVIDKMMSTKPGTRDRAVAYEDVFKHSIMSGSLDDVRMVRKTLQTAGPEGQQAWKELQGATVQHIKDEITKNVSTDIRGNTIVSADKLTRVVRELDKDGKLDFIFGKQGAQQMRDITEAAKDVLTFPPGSVNTSGTASVLLDALGSAAVGRLPTAAAQAIAAVRRIRESSAMKKRVAEALNPPVD
jgi:hypothetical protein